MVVVKWEDLSLSPGESVSPGGSKAQQVLGYVFCKKIEIRAAAPPPKEWPTITSFVDGEIYL